MKAIVYDKYGPPDGLYLQEVAGPAPGDDEVLVKIYASCVNDWDWGLLQGKPFTNRLLSGLLKPKKMRVLGSDVAGVVETIGNNVKRFQPGDEVFGDLSDCGFGGFAEYVCAREDALVLKPPDMTFEEAAAIPQAAILALRGLRNKRQVLPGQKVLINGAGGGAGTFAIQIAKYFGTEVTGVDSTGKLDTMLSTGADHVIDFTREDFTKKKQRYDLILDFSAHHSIFDYMRALSPGGTYIVVGGSTARLIQIITLGPLISMTGSKKTTLLIHRQNEGLDVIKELFEAGKLKPVIDKCYTLEETSEALQYFGTGQARGKLVITVKHPD